MTKQKLDDGYQAVAFEVGKSLENAERRIRELEAQSEAMRKALEMVEWVSTAGCDHSMLECPWCDELEYPNGRHADDCARQAALAPTPTESEVKK